jgi:nitric oxide reductase activation protein
MEMREQQTKKQNFAAANAERKKQIADDTEKLLKLAADLKAEVDKTSKDTLSLNVIRRADEIERLAHSVKEKMKLSVGGG